MLNHDENLMVRLKLSAIKHEEVRTKCLFYLPSFGLPSTKMKVIPKYKGKFHSKFCDFHSMTEKAVKFGAFMSKMLCLVFLLNISSGKMVEVHSESAPKIGHNWQKCTYMP